MNQLNNMQQQMKLTLKRIETNAMIHNIELWKRIDGYPNYEISSHGHVENITTGRILKPRLRNGYKLVNLCNEKQ